MNFKNIKINYEPWTYAVVDNFLSQKEILNLKKEIINFKSFDDKVMINRNRINKGSDNFNKIIQHSKNIKKLYNRINSQKFYRKVYNFFDPLKIQWTPEADFKKYSWRAKI